MKNWKDINFGNCSGSGCCRWLSSWDEDVVGDGGPRLHTEECEYNGDNKDVTGEDCQGCPGFEETPEEEEEEDYTGEEKEDM